MGVTPKLSVFLLKMTLSHPTLASCVSTLGQSTLLDADIHKAGIMASTWVYVLGNCCSAAAAFLIRTSGCIG